MTSKLYAEDGTPIPFEEAVPTDPPGYADPCDRLIPRGPGLIRDLIYTQRRTEVPTLYSIWTALFVLSTVIKREAWLKWGKGKLFSGYYTLIIGPPAMKKGQALDDAIGMMKNFQSYIEDEQIRKMKFIFTLQDKLTPEYLYEAMRLKKRMRFVKPFQLKDAEGRPLLGPDRKPLFYKATSELAIFLHEMAVTAGKRKYSEGLIEDLLTLYDPRDYFEWSTIKRDKIILRDTHTTLCALTTPRGFRESIPEVASSDGFLSRCAVVYQTYSPREFRRPEEVPGLPPHSELARRLGWIAERAIGEYDLSAPADEYYTQWYSRFKKRQEVDLAYSGVYCRLFTLLLKVALLLYLQRYDRDPDSDKIGLQDIQDADVLIRGMVGESSRLLGHLTSGDRSDCSVKVQEFLKKAKSAKRGVILKNLHVKAQELTEVIDQLSQEGKVLILRGGKTIPVPSRDGEEVYEWQEEVESEGSRAENPEDVQGLPVGEEDSQSGRLVKGKRSPSASEKRRTT